MSHRIRLDLIVFDAGTQIREAISEQVVSDYAERMTEGQVFPAIVLFHDGNQYYLADGFHRALAAKRNDFKDISAEIRPGTKTDALWFALGANKQNGHRMTAGDLKHAIVLAFQTWPERSATQVAAQVGCTDGYVGRIREQVHTSMNLPSRVVGKDGKSYPASTRKNAITQEQVDRIAKLVALGRSFETIAGEVGVSASTVGNVKARLGFARPTSKASVKERRERMRAMASEGYSSIQIAAALNVSVDCCRDTLRAEGIPIPGDRATQKTRRHDSNRIMEQIVLEADHLTSDVVLIGIEELDQARLPDWLSSLKASQDKLREFIRRLMKERQKHGEAA